MSNRMRESASHYDEEIPAMASTCPRPKHGQHELQRNIIGRVNVGDIVTRSAARAPGDLAIVDGDRRMSYGEFKAAVNRLANALIACDYQRGDALALASGNSVEFLQTYFACAKVGVVCV